MNKMNRTQAELLERAQRKAFTGDVEVVYSRKNKQWGVNWVCMGAQDLHNTITFIETMKRAVALAQMLNALAVGEEDWSLPDFHDFHSRDEFDQAVVEIATGILDKDEQKIFDWLFDEKAWGVR